jgi:uncharacterized membrane protein
LAKNCPSDICSSSNMWTCSLDLTSLTISPGRSASTTLHVKSPSCAKKNDYKVSVTATPE